MHFAVLPFCVFAVITALPVLFAVSLPVFLSTDTVLGSLELKAILYAAAPEFTRQSSFFVSPAPSVRTPFSKLRVLGDLFTVILQLVFSPFARVAVITDEPVLFALIFPLSSTFTTVLSEELHFIPLPAEESRAFRAAVSPAPSERAVLLNLT